MLMSAEATDGNVIGQYLNGGNSRFKAHNTDRIIPMCYYGINIFALFADTSTFKEVFSTNCLFERLTVHSAILVNKTKIKNEK